MTIGPWQIPLYTWRVGLGVLVGLGWLGWAAPQYELTRRQAIGLAWRVALGALLTGRLGYILGNPAYFQQHPWAILQFPTVGGLHGGSAWLGGWLVVQLWHRWQAPSGPALWGLWLPISLGCAAGAWWGCAEIGCAWGQAVTLPPAAWRWAVPPAPDLYHLVAFRYPIQWLGAGWAVALLALALRWPRQSGLWAALYFLGEALLTLGRADPVPLLGDYRVDTLLDIGWVGCWLVIQIWPWRKASAMDNPA